MNHYQDQTRARRDPKYVEGRGILYPRAGTLGGCVSHNALIWITPHASDWDNIASITGDDTWSAANMNKYLAKVYEWQSTGPADPAILLKDTMLVQHLAGGAAVMGVGPDPLAAVTGLAGTLLVDPNNTPGRDSLEGLYQIPLIQRGGARVSVRDFIVSTKDSGFPLTIRTNCHVTKITFDTNGTTPKAVGVEFLDGQHLYRASPLSGGAGTPGKATARKEVIMAGGSYNTVQTLKLSGIGPASELNKFGIEVVKDVPGLGKNMQDRYEIPVNARHPNDFSILNGCTFDAKPQDKCYTQWENNPNVLGLRGAYGSNGLAAAVSFCDMSMRPLSKLTRHQMAVNSDFADNSDIDLFIFGGPVNFTGYFPRWGDAAVASHKVFSWYTLKAHTRNTAGTVELSSADPLDTPIINFNYFDTGTTANGADVKDVNAMVQAIKMSREANSRYSDYAILGGTDFTEERPGAAVDTDAELQQFVKDEAWGHHACCTAPIGAQSDSKAVLDSKFRVKGVDGLRVVDASVFPKIPGIFIQAPIFMISEKAADVILNG